MKDPDTTGPDESLQIASRQASIPSGMNDSPYAPPLPDPERGAGDAPPPLPPGVCVEVFAATSVTPKTGVDTVESASDHGFVVTTHRFTRRRFRGIFTLPHSVLLTSHTGCGCGFGFGLPDATPEQILEAFLKAPQEAQLRSEADTNAMASWIRAHTPVELWIRTNRLDDERPSRRKRIHTRELDEHLRTLRVGDLIRVEQDTTPAR